MKNLREAIAQGINHGLNDAEIAVELINKGLVVAMSPVLIGVIRDLMTEKPAPTTQLQYSKTDLDNNKGGGGLEIKIEGCPGDPTDNDPGTSIFVEYYKDEVLVHVWDGTQQDPYTHKLSQV